MSHIDDLFRDGLSGRKADIPNASNLWARINAAKQQPLPADEDMDRAFSEKLRDRVAPIPVGMWGRIAAARARRPLAKWLLSAAALLLLLIVAGISFSRTGGDTLQSPTTTPATDTPIASTDRLPITKVASEHEVNDALSPAELADDGVSLPAVSTNKTTASNNLPLATTPAEDLTAPSSSKGERLQESMDQPIDPRPSPLRNTSSALAIEALPGLPIELLSVETELPESGPLGSPTFRNSGSRGLQTELLFGISYARQEFSLQDPSAASLRDLRQASEYPEFGYQITLRGTYQFSERIRLLAGLTYAEIRNELEYDLVTNGSSRLVRTNNNIRMLEAPVLVGYSVPGRRVNVTVNAGPVVNLTTSVRGRFLDPDFSQPQDLAADGNFRKNIGVGFMTSLSTTYQIGKQHPFTLLVEPYFKTYPTAFTVKSAPIREKYWVAGIQLGVRKTLR